MAEIAPDAVKGGMAADCESCRACISACPTRALLADKVTTLNLAGTEVGYLPVDANRCDWATKYALVCEEGNMFVGNYTNIPCPEEINAENLADALRQQDNVFKFRPVTGERCVVACPLMGKK